VFISLGFATYHSQTLSLESQFASYSIFNILDSFIHGFKGQDLVPGCKKGKKLHIRTGKTSAVCDTTRHLPGDLVE
jgi:hypothetical protein